MITEQPLVSIIIPTYNRAHLIGETLDSVLAQTYSNWECIIVDDGSSDNTDEVVGDYVKKDPRFKYVHRPDTHLPGGNGARNYGFLQSKGEYIQWFDSDDVMLPEYIRERIKLFNQDLSMVICSGYYWDETRSAREQIDLSLKNSLYQDYVLWKLKVLTPSILFKKEYLIDKVLFSNKILRGQEAEFFSRLFFQLPEISFKIINAPLFLYRQHSDTKSVRDSEYIPSYKESRFIYLFDNFKRCQIINFQEAKISLYKSILKLFFEALDYNHKKLSNLIIKDFFQLLKNENYYKAIELIIIGKILTFLKYPRLKFHNRWKYFMFTK